MQRKLTHTIVRIVTVLLAVISTINGGSAYAQDGVGISFENWATGFCLDSNTKRHVYTLRCNDGNFQDWIVINNRDDRTITLRNDATGFCLDSNTKRKVYTLKCNGGSFQRWIFTPRANGTLILKNLATRFCLDSNKRGNVYTHACNGGNFQRWKLR
jgi:hypothetical protein